MWNDLFERLVRFAVNEDLTCNIARMQLRAMWTTYCICREFEVDTADYDDAIDQVWDAMCEHNSQRYFENLDLFYMYMCQLLT